MILVQVVTGKCHRQRPPSFDKPQGRFGKYGEIARLIGFGENGEVERFVVLVKLPYWLLLVKMVKLTE